MTMAKGLPISYAVGKLSWGVRFKKAMVGYSSPWPQLHVRSGAANSSKSVRASEKVAETVFGVGFVLVVKLYRTPLFLNCAKSLELIVEARKFDLQKLSAGRALWVLGLRRSGHWN